MAHVAIVGAGPAGGALGYLLARRGIGVTLIERQTDFAREFRGELLMPSGIEALSQMGLAAAADRVPHVAIRALEPYLLGRRLFRVELGDAAAGGNVPRWTSQPELLEMLVAEAARFPAFHFERGASVRELIHQDGRVSGVRCQTLNGEREILADLVVGADGRTSVTRKRSGIAARCDRVAFDVVWCKVPLPGFIASDPHARGYLGHGHLLIAAPTPDDRLQLGWVIRKGTFGDLRRRGIPEWLDELANHVSPDLADHLRRHREDVSRPFLLDTVSDHVATWSVPGLLLIGDAAHTMSPVGAQGLNIALRDAIVAANHLVPLLMDGAAPAALDAAAGRIQAERQPEVDAIQRIQRVPPYVILSRSWWSKLVLQVLPFVLREDIARGRGGTVFRRIAFGVTDVQLRV